MSLFYHCFALLDVLVVPMSPSRLEQNKRGLGCWKVLKVLKAFFLSHKGSFRY